MYFRIDEDLECQGEQIYSQTVINILYWTLNKGDA